MLKLVMEFTFEDEIGAQHSMRLFFVGANFHEAYEDAMNFITETCKDNDWCLFKFEIVDVMDTHN